MDLKDRISKAVIEMIYTHTIFANVVILCGGVQIDEKKNIALAYTNGKGVFLCKKVIDKFEKSRGIPLDIEEIIFLIAHEALHLITLSIDRLEKKNHKIWNMATDYVINSILIEEKVGTFLKEGLYGPEYKNKSADQIYIVLKADIENQIKHLIKTNIFDGNNISLNPFFDDTDLDLGDEWKNLKGDARDKLIKKIQELLDSMESGNGEFKLDDHEMLDNISIDDEQSIMLKVNDILSQNAGRNGLCERLLNLRRLPKFNWKQALNGLIKSFLLYNSSWREPSKRSISIDGYLPKIYKTPSINIAVGIDTSGSISDDTLSNFFNHLRSIMYSFGHFTIDVHCFSTQVHEKTITRFTKQNFRDDLIKNFKTESNGGTNIASSFNFIENDKLNKYDCYICMTDGCDNIEKLKFSKIPVIWAITNDRKHQFKSPIGVKRSKVIFIDV